MYRDFEGILIHPGNTAADTEGCILVGQKRSVSEIFQSRIAFNALFAKLNGTIGKRWYRHDSDLLKSGASCQKSGYCSYFCEALRAASNSSPGSH